jgi:M6 family metalloprotease-like protein
MRWVDLSGGIMRRKRIAAVAAVLAAVVAGVPAAGAHSSAKACEITAPPEGWPDGTSAGFDTNLHHGLDSDWRLHVRPVGRVRAAMVFVDFPNARAEDNAAPYAETGAYHDFLAPAVDWFRRSSYGRFDLEITQVPTWFRMSRPDAEYGLDRDNFTVENQLAYVREAVELADPEVDFRRYDLLYVVPSRNAENVAFSPEFNDYTRTIVADGNVLSNGATYGQDMWGWGYKILNHETGHAISLPESYNASGIGGTHRFVGGWDMMGNIAGRAPELMGWNKWKLDWLARRQVGCVTKERVSFHRLTPIEVGGPRGRGDKLLVVRTGRYTAWVAELRRALGNDAGTICDPGVLVYRLDASIPNGDGSIQVHDAKPMSGRQGPCTELDIGTLGRGAGEPSVFHDAATGVTIEVLWEREGEAVVRVTRDR